MQAQHHEKNLKVILCKTNEEFSQWVGHLTDEEMTYVEWLLNRAENSLDNLLMEQSNLKESRDLIEKVMKIQ